MGPTAADRGYRIRRYRPEDRPVLLEILGQVWNRETSRRIEAIWDWKFERNPHNPPGGHGSLVIDHRDEPVGFLGFLAARFRRGQEESTLVWGTELCIRPEHRGMGYLVFQHIAQDEPLTVAGNAGNPAIHDLQTKFGAFEVTRWVNCKKILDGRRFAATKVPGPLAALAGPAVDLAGGVLSRGRPGRSDQELRCERIEGFDDRFDDFWAEAAAGHPFICVRDRAFLNWRFLECPVRKYEPLAVFAGRELRGYAVLRHEKDASLPRGLIVDILTRNGDDQAFGALVAAAEARFRAEGSAVMSCTVSGSRPDLIALLGRCGLRLRTKGIPVTAHPGNDPGQAGIEALLRDGRSLYLTRADTDLDYNNS